MIQLSDAYMQSEQFHPAVTNLEQASMILTALEEKAKGDELSRISLQLNKVYL